jgi:hypothetical protein
MEAMDMNLMKLIRNSLNATSLLPDAAASRNVRVFSSFLSLAGFQQFGK